MTERCYIGGRYQYREMRRPKWAAIHYRTNADMDALPCTMIDIIRVWAPNKVTALREIKDEVAYRESHGMR